MSKGTKPAKTAAKKPTNVAVAADPRGRVHMVLVNGRKRRFERRP